MVGSRTCEQDLVSGSSGRRELIHPTFELSNHQVQVHYRFIWSTTRRKAVRPFVLLLHHQRTKLPRIPRTNGQGYGDFDTSYTLGIARLGFRSEKDGQDTAGGQCDGAGRPESYRSGRSGCVPGTRANGSGQSTRGLAMCNARGRLHGCSTKGRRR